MNERLIENWRIHSCKYQKKIITLCPNYQAKLYVTFRFLNSVLIISYHITYWILNNDNDIDDDGLKHNMWPFSPLHDSPNSGFSVSFWPWKKGSNNLASGSIFCSPSIFYWGHRQFLSTCSCSSTMYMCILYYTMYILSTSYILLRYVLQQLETGNPTIKKINQLSHGNINEDTRSSSTQYILPS